MTFFEESHWQPARALSAEQVAYFRDVMRTHTNDPITGTCAVCQIAGCPDWRDAYDQLAVAGEMMAEPERWMTATGDTKGRR